MERVRSRRGGYWIVVLACVFLTMTLVSGCENVQRDQSDTMGFQVSFIDVGKGDCILLQSPAHTVLIDTGYEETAGRVLGFLKKQRVERIDEMIVTHFDKDHDGGAPAILEEVEVSKVYLPDYEGEGGKYDKLVASLDKHDVEPERLTEDVSYTVDGVEYQIFVSGVEYDPEKENDNDMSLVILATYGDDSWLFAGDLEKKGLKTFLERHGEIQCDIIKMPHHGQYVSVTDDLLEQVQPKIAVITDGVEKPAEEKLTELLEQTQVEYYRSLINGTIVIKGNGEGDYKTVTDK